MNFAQKLQLSLLGDDGIRYYLHSERLSMHRMGARFSGQQTVTLTTDGANAGTAWEAVYLDHSERMENEGLPVMINSKFLLRNANTNMCLATLAHHLVRSDFGVEYEVTCHTHLTSFKLEGPENQWCIEMKSDMD